jgi:hypothetical protein
MYNQYATNLNLDYDRIQKEIEEERIKEEGPYYPLVVECFQEYIIRKTRNKRCSFNDNVQSILDDMTKENDEYDGIDYDTIFERIFQRDYRKICDAIHEQNKNIIFSVHRSIPGGIARIECIVKKGPINID